MRPDLRRIGSFAGSFIFFLFFAGALPLLSAEVGTNDPLYQREEKIKAFRTKRNHFFKDDPRSPLKEDARKGFKGLIYYPIDLKYVITGFIETYSTTPKPIYVNLPTNRGKDRKYVKYGRFRFELDGKKYVLHLYRPLGEEEVFLPFKDKTSGRETYPHGRYLFIETLSDGRVLIDFNRAYNPFCEYNEKFTCPFAPPENWLDTEIRAGEKRFQR
jgi:uncharacterized protein (DUF1684 family)